MKYINVPVSRKIPHIEIGNIIEVILKKFIV